MNDSPIHIAAKKSWWDGSVTMLCGLKFAGGNHSRLIFVKSTCSACLAARKAEHAMISDLVTRYHPPISHGSGGGLLATFVHSIVASLGWHAGASIAHLLGGWLIVLAVVAGLVYLARNHRARARGRRTARRGRGRR